MANRSTRQQIGRLGDDPTIDGSAKLAARQAAATRERLATVLPRARLSSGVRARLAGPKAAWERAQDDAQRGSAVAVAHRLVGV